MKLASRIMFILVITLYCEIVAASEVKNGVLLVKPGSIVYSCVCGESCGCGTIGKTRGKCQCGHDLEKVTVTSVENGSAVFNHNGTTHRLPLTGKYTCACESKCCEIISQKQVTCGCGKEMKAIK